MSTTRDLFEEIRGMVHRGDPLTSIDSAIVISRKVNALHEKVAAAIRRGGPMTDEELEQLPEFRGFGPSTVRKRRSELYQAGILHSVGTRKNARGRAMIVWDFKPAA